MAWRKFPDGNGCTMTVYDIDGRMFAFPPKYWHEITAMKSRPDDVLICAFPKSGMHWVWEILTMLVGGMTQLTTDRMENHGLLLLASVPELDALPSPRVLTTHRLFHELPSDFIINKRKLVLVLRDPKDACVSAYHMFQSVKHTEYSGTWDGFLPLFLEGQIPSGSWANWVLSFEKGLKEHPEIPVHVVHYEKLKADPASEVKKLAEFLDASSASAEKVAEATEFSLMKKFKDGIPNPFISAYKNEQDPIFHVGESGKWREWFIEEQATNFDNHLKRRLGRDKVEAYL